MRLATLSEDLGSYFAYSFGASFGIYLEPGSYGVEASRTGFLPKFQPVDVAGPQIVTVTMEPEP